MTAKRNRGLLEHHGGCPGERVETYELPRPGGGMATVTRCIDCGAHRADGLPPAAEAEPEAA